MSNQFPQTLLSQGNENSSTECIRARHHNNTTHVLWPSSEEGEPVQDLIPADSSLTPFIRAKALGVAPSALLTRHRTQSEHPHSPKPLWALINASVHELHTIALKISLKHYPNLKKKKNKANFRSNPGGVEKPAHIVHTHNCASIPHKPAVWFPFLLLSEHTPRIQP